jgi:hypothetical protein
MSALERSAPVGAPEDDAVSLGPTAARLWLVIASLVLIAVFLQPLFAGLMVRGHEWANAAHENTAIGLVAVAVIATLVAAVTLRRRADGRAVVVALLTVAVLLVVQTALGETAADGKDVLWLHFPLGVALVGAGARLVRAARRLGGARPGLSIDPGNT